MGLLAGLDWPVRFKSCILVSRAIETTTLAVSAISLSSVRYSNKRTLSSTYLFNKSSSLVSGGGISFLSIGS